MPAWWLWHSAAKHEVKDLVLGQCSHSPVRAQCRVCHTLCVILWVHARAVLLHQWRHFDKNTNSCAKLPQTQKVDLNCAKMHQNGFRMSAPAVAANSQWFLRERVPPFAFRTPRDNVSRALSSNFHASNLHWTFRRFRQVAGARTAAPGCCRCCRNCQGGCIQSVLEYS